MKIAVMGAAGRMGQELVRAVKETSGCTIVGAIEKADSPAIGADIGVLAGIGPLGVTVGTDPLDIIARSDAILDFTTPKSTVEFAALAANARIVHVIGTTGLSEADEARIAAAARHAPIIKAGNMSLGVNLVAAITRRVAEALDEDFDIEIVEMHHRDKVDAPSGTALMLAAAAAQGRGVKLDERAVRGRDGITGPRRRGDIGSEPAGGSVVESTGSFSPVRASASRLRISPAIEASSRAAPSRRCCGAAARRRDFILCPTCWGSSVMIEKFTGVRGMPLSEFLDLNHTRIISLLVSFRSRSSFIACRQVRRTSRSGH
jgi:4-hydroxy-tetrahydrodipicolinate reductase